SGLKAVIATLNDIDLRLSDLTMPNMSGMDAYNVMSKYRPLKTIFMSGYQEEVFWLGQRGFKAVVKPFDTNELLATIREMLNSHDA
ncbi:response regulator, partial [Candidatus Falkowbacteria bacterium]|nr:response regulator [Candidatus Falkowbacteria bacterium]